VKLPGGVHGTDEGARPYRRSINDLQASSTSRSTAISMSGSSFTGGRGCGFMSSPINLGRTEQLGHERGCGQNPENCHKHYSMVSVGWLNDIETTAFSSLSKTQASLCSVVTLWRG
jgi:hypothetical protein